ncbi:LysM peptidoglycan-binding domain-containing protein [Parapedobacter sp. DT-150]|uniref:lytic transglycosylase domain-containing protein n=1 Tax=Parapedobacter sp. DT-150 TaxID=3396162 RepID=UPI003F1C81E0
MKLKSISAIAVSSLLCTYPAFSKATFLDSLSDTTTKVDTLAKRAVKQLDLQHNLTADSANFAHLKAVLHAPPIFEYATATIQGRLAYLQKTVPLTYNSQVQSYIDRYSTAGYRMHLSSMMGLARYYFPIYERVFAKTGIPDEIKYLSIVESALNPHAKSRVGATGPWQFMFATASAYDLAMDSYVDERKDPVASSYAAASYLLDAYNEFGDWLLAIASYNCGKGNVLRAIQRSGLRNPDYWAISNYLPRETRHYVPAFIAITYMLGYHEEHGIVPADTELLLNTETVWVQKFVPFSHVARALGIDEDVVSALNPAYKRGVVNGDPTSPKRLILPEVRPEAYSALYTVLNSTNEVPVVQHASAVTGPAARTATAIHRVLRGETLGEIAQRYRVTVQDLRAWNNIKQNVIVPGQRLSVGASDEGSSDEAARAASGSYISYRVKRGDTLSSIANRHRGANISAIKAENGLKGSTIKPGMTLKINVD